MKKQLLAWIMLPLVSATWAQTANDLSSFNNLLSGSKTIQLTSGYNIFEKADADLSGNYTIEVKAKVSDTDSRGLDVKASDASGMGFRVSANKTDLHNTTNILATAASVHSNDNTQLTTFRYVMYNDALSIYKNNDPVAVATDIAKSNVVRNLIDDGGFENGGFSKWTQTANVGTVEIKSGDEIIQYKNNALDEPNVIPSSGKALFFTFNTGSNGQGWYYPTSLTPGVYELKLKSLQFTTAGELANVIKNTLVRVRTGVGFTGTSLIYAYLNGHSGNGNWVNTSLKFIVPEGAAANDISIIIEKSNNNKIYFDDFQLVRMGDNIPILGANDASAQTGIYDIRNLIGTNPGFENDAIEASPIGWTANQPMGMGFAYYGARVAQPDMTGTDKEGTNTLMMRFEQGYTWFARPIKLNSGKMYKLMFTYAQNKSTSVNANAKAFNVAVCNAEDGSAATTELIRSSFTPDGTANACIGKDGVLYFTTPADLGSDQMYISFFKNATNAPVFHVDKVILQEVDATPLNKLIVGKNYFFGGANMELESVKFVNEAYVPSNVVSIEKEKVENNVYYNASTLYVNDSEINNLSVLDLRGKTIFAKTVVNTEQIYLPLPKGVYFVKTNKGNSKFIIK